MVSIPSRPSYLEYSIRLGMVNYQGRIPVTVIEQSDILMFAEISPKRRGSKPKFIEAY